MRRVLFATACLALLSSCGRAGDLCQKASRMASTLRGKSCFPPSVGDFSVEICEKKVVLCTPEEVEKLMATVDCIDKVPACTGPQDPDFAVNFFRCEAYYSGTDTDCVSAIFSQN